MGCSSSTESNTSIVATNKPNNEEVKNEQPQTEDLQQLEEEETNVKNEDEIQVSGSAPDSEIKEENSFDNLPSKPVEAKIPKEPPPPPPSTILRPIPDEALQIIVNKSFYYLSKHDKLALRTVAKVLTPFMDTYWLKKRPCVLNGVEITSKDFRKLPRTLEELKCDNCRITEEEDEDEVFKYIPPNLIRLELSRTEAMTDEASKYFPKKLEHLNLSGCAEITEESLKNLPQQLKFLDISDCISIDNAALSKLPPLLTHLNISENEVNDKALASLPATLQTLILSGCKQITDNAISSLPKLLLNLNIKDCPRLTDNIFKDLPPGTQLFQSLEFTNLSLKALQSLHIGGRTAITEQGLGQLPALLTELNVSDWVTSDDAVQFFPSTLKKLSLARCKWTITDAAVRNLPRSITDLDLSSCMKVTNAGLEHLPPKLISLRLRDCDEITDEGLPHMPQTLTYLDLSGCPEISDQGLSEYLPRNVKHLEIAGTAVSEEFKDSLREKRIEVVD